jgi:hypothetical protein
MARRLSSIYPTYTGETRQAAKLAKLLTEDFNLDLERTGYYLVRNHAMIVAHRFEVLSLATLEEYDKLMAEMKGIKYEPRR